MDKVWDSVYKACLAWEERIGEGRPSEKALEAIVQAHEQEVALLQRQVSLGIGKMAGMAGHWLLGVTMLKGRVAGVLCSRR